MENYSILVNLYTLQSSNIRATQRTSVVYNLKYEVVIPPSKEKWHKTIHYL